MFSTSKKMQYVRKRVRMKSCAIRIQSAPIATNGLEATRLAYPGLIRAVVEVYLLMVCVPASVDLRLIVLRVCCLETRTVSGVQLNRDV